MTNEPTQPTNKIIRCRTIPREVEAVLWDGENTAQLEAWGCYTIKPDENSSIYINELGAEEFVAKGWWIVKDPDEEHEFWPEPPEKFALWFKPIAAQPTDTEQRQCLAHCGHDPSFVKNGVCIIPMGMDACMHRCTFEQPTEARHEWAYCADCGNARSMDTLASKDTFVCRYCLSTKPPTFSAPVHQPATGEQPASTQIVTTILALIDHDVNFQLNWDCHSKRWRLQVGWLAVDVNDKSLLTVLMDGLAETDKANTSLRTAAGIKENQ